MFHGSRVEVNMGADGAADLRSSLGPVGNGKSTKEMETILM